MNQQPQTSTAKKGLFRIVFSRTGIILLLLAAQIALMFGTIYYLHEYIHYVYGTLVILQVIALIYLINAEGNYNMEYAGEYDDCWGWGNNITFRYLSENPLSGANDQTEAINTTGESLSFFSDFHKGINNKIKDGVLYNQLICSGDNWDGFESGRVLDISSNPTPINAATYHANYSGNRYTKVDNQRDTRKKYLTGLSIKMNHAYNIGNTSVFKVDIRWDDYDVKQNVHWAGNIVLKEQLNLLEGKTIYLEQNLTPSQINRDPISGVYAPPTMFTCESGSNMSLAQNASLLLQDKSSLIFEAGTGLQIADRGSIVVEAGSTLIIKSGASVSVSGTGKIYEAYAVPDVRRPAAAGGHCQGIGGKPSDHFC